MGSCVCSMLLADFRFGAISLAFAIFSRASFRLIYGGANLSGMALGRTRVATAVVFITINLRLLCEVAAGSLGMLLPYC